ncbi:minor capsid protein [Enterococcus thailandicus]|uniref:minor capsid protein n=1 Tax=Enterococcus thailandicus TaxID=417368 RepID=UPI002556ED1F|nr:minor capsid protein [Enterococcus thailandicus]
MMVKKNNKQSSKYWSSRMDEIMAYVDRTDIDFFDELQNIYTESRQNIQKEIYAFYAQYAKENKISVQEAKKRLMREDLSDYRANAEKYFKQAKKDPELFKRLNEQYKAGKVTRLEALHLNLDWQLGKMNSSLHKSFESYLKEVAQYAYRKIAGGNSQSTLNKSALEQIIKIPFNGKNYSASIWGNTDDLAKDLKKVLTQGFIRGSGPADMARELRKKYNVAKSRAEAIVRTDGTNVVNLSAAKRFEEFGLTRYKNNVHVDSRTTDICLQINREDKSYLLSEYQPGQTAPPYHVGCRTGIVPDDEELGYEEEERPNHDSTNYVRDKEDKQELKSIQQILKDKQLKLEEFQQMKYNNIKEYEKLLREQRTIKELKGKNWSKEFKEKTTKTYYQFLDYGFELSSHALGRYVQRTDLSIEDSVKYLSEKANFIQEDGRKVWFYDGHTFIENADGTELVTYVYRKNKKPKGGENPWKSIN